MAPEGPLLGHLLRQWLSQSESLSGWWGGPAGPGLPPVGGARTFVPSGCFWQLPAGTAIWRPLGVGNASPCHVMVA